MSDQVWISIITGIIGIISTLISSYVVLQLARMKVGQETNTAKIDEIHKQTNGLTEKLVKATSIVAHAQGMADEKSDEIARRK